MAASSTAAAAGCYSLPAWARNFVSEVHPHVRVERSLHGLSLHALGPIAAGSRLMLLPYVSMMSESYAVSSKIGRDLFLWAQKVGVQQPCPRVVLYVVMILERANLDDIAAPFGPYLRAIPTKFDDLLCWEPSEMAEVGGTGAEEATRVKQSWLRGQFDAVFVPEVPSPLPHLAIASLFPPSAALWEAFQWAHSAFASRAFPHALSERPAGSTEAAASTNFAGEESAAADAPFVGALFPVMDLANHAYRCAVSWVRCETGLSFESGANIAEGNEIYNNYGPKSNEELLLSYGFVLPGNPRDTFAVKIAISSPAPLRNLLRALTVPLRHELRRWGTDLRVTLDFCHPRLYVDEHIPTALILAMRASGLREEQLSYLHSALESSAAGPCGISEVLSHPLCECSESQMRSTLKSLLRSKLSRLLHLHSWLASPDATAPIAACYYSSDISPLPLRASLAREYVGGQSEILCDAIESIEEAQWSIRTPTGPPRNICSRDSSAAVPFLLAALPGVSCRLGYYMRGSSMEMSELPLFAQFVVLSPLTCPSGVSDIEIVQPLSWCTSLVSAPVSMLLCRDSINSLAPSLAKVLDGVPGLEVRNSAETAAEYDRDQDFVLVAIFLLFLRSQDSEARVSLADQSLSFHTYIGAYLKWAAFHFGAHSQSTNTSEPISSATDSTSAELSKRPRNALGAATDQPPPPSAKRECAGTKVEVGPSSSTSADAASHERISSSTIASSNFATDACGQPLTRMTPDERAEILEMYADVVAPLCRAFPATFPRQSFSKRQWMWACLLLARCGLPLTVRGRTQLSLFPLFPLPEAPAQSVNCVCTQTPWWSCPDRCYCDLRLCVPSSSHEAPCSSGSSSSDMMPSALAHGAPNAMLISSPNRQLRVGDAVYWNICDAACGVTPQDVPLRALAGYGVQPLAWPAGVVDGVAVRASVLPADAARLQALRARVARALQTT